MAIQVGNAGENPPPPLDAIRLYPPDGSSSLAKEKATTYMITLLRKTVDDSINLSA